MEHPMKAVTPSEPFPNLPYTHVIDTRIYTDPAIFEEERVKIFARVWNFVCHESEIPTPGSFRTVSVAGYPLLVVRQTDGTIAAFYNVCRHRQAQVVRTCSGQAKMFQCFYHLWTYGIDGRLLGVTLPDGYKDSGFKKEEFSLRKVRADQVAGMVFVCLNDDAESLREYLGETVAALERHEAEKLEVFHLHSAEIKTNWKLFMENNNEQYHTGLHWTNRSVGNWGKPSKRNALNFVRNGHNCTPPDKGHDRGQFGYRNVGFEERTENLLPGLRPNESTSMHLFPDVLFHTRSTVLRMDRLIPVSPGRTILESRGFGVKDDPTEVRATRLRHHNEIWGYSGSNLPEDIAATESQWPMMACGAIRYSIIAREGDLYSDESLRRYYAEWSRRIGRSYWDPFEELPDLFHEEQESDKVAVR